MTLEFMTLNGNAFEANSAELLDYIKNNAIKTLEIKFQNGPIKEVGRNGAQYDQLIRVAKAIIEKLNKQVPCRQNSMVITKLDEALLWLHHRYAERTERGVEGFKKS